MPKVFEAPPGFVLNPDYLVPELRAQRDALLEALKRVLDRFDPYAVPGYETNVAAEEKARAAIASVEETK